MRSEFGRNVARFCIMAERVAPDVDPMKVLNAEVQLYAQGNEDVSDLAKWMYGRTHR